MSTDALANYIATLPQALKNLDRDTLLLMWRVNSAKRRKQGLIIANKVLHEKREKDRASTTIKRYGQRRKSLPGGKTARNKALLRYMEALPQSMPPAEKSLRAVRWLEAFERTANLYVKAPGRAVAEIAETSRWCKVPGVPFEARWPEERAFWDRLPEEFSKVEGRVVGGPGIASFMKKAIRQGALRQVRKSWD